MKKSVVKSLSPQLKSLSQSFNHWSIDTEDDSKGHLYIIDFFDGKTHYTFSEKEINANRKRPLSKKRVTEIIRQQAVDFLATLPQQNCTFWCTNLGYDLVNVFYEHLQVLEIGYIGSRIISAKVPGTQFRFYDTLNHWKMSIKKMGERIGHEKLDAGKSFNNIRYCRRDNEICWFFVAKMREVYHEIGCDLRATVGSTALKYFQKEFFDELDRVLDEKHLNFMKGGYYGGRTEVFHTEPVRGRIHYFDFNSLYPAVNMNLYPIIEDGGFYFTKKPDFEKFEGVADVTVFCPYMPIPYLPHRGVSERLIFPVGRFRGRYTYFEIRRAQTLGYKVEKVHRALEFSAGVFRPFSEFVTTLYNRRLKAQKIGDELMSDGFKGLMNNLYGKWGQGKHFERLVAHEGRVKPGDKILGPYKIVATDESDPHPKHTNYLWAMYTTAYGRDRLYFNGLYRVAQTEGARLLYCDTDSIIFESRKTIFKSSKKLGELKSEGDFIEAQFKLPKLYYLISKDGKSSHKAKGIRRDNAREYFETGKTKFKRPYKLRETLRRNQSKKASKKLVANFWDEIEKVNMQVYDKRIVNSDGSTTPIIMGGVRYGKTGRKS